MLYEYYNARQTYIGVVLLTFSSVKYTVKMLIKFNKLYIKLKVMDLLEHFL